LFLNVQLPERESVSRVWLIRAFALATLALTYGYLGWRMSSTVNLAFWWVSLPLIVVEIHSALGMTLYTLAGWSVDAVRPASPVQRSKHRVAVAIPTYNEPEEVLLPAIAAAIVLEPAHETWVLDDGNRPSVRALAENLGARYLARASNEGAKAGNINNALPHIDADVIAFLDADYVALPGFLTNTLAYFDDPTVAVVQTPQDFYNEDSFEHEDVGGGRTFYEEGVFYRVLGPGKNHWGGAFWCGTCALVRKSALLSVGGAATETVTEDIHTTIRMHRRGWRTVYHNEVLARGLAPADASQYMMQRNRWARGAMQTLRLERPLTSRGLSWGQRLGYATTLFAWFDSWRTLTYMTLPVAVMLTGASPIDAPGSVYGPMFLATLGAQFVALRLLARGYYPPMLSLLFEVLRMPAVIPATLAVFAPRRHNLFKVTPKGRHEGARGRGSVPLLLRVLLVSSTVGLAWFAVVISGVAGFAYAHPESAIGAAFFATTNAVLIVGAIRRIRDRKYAGERRNSVRFPVRLDATVDGAACEVRDLSLTGALAYVPFDDVPERNVVTLAISGPGGAIRFKGSVRRRRPHMAGRIELGVEFEAGQQREMAHLALWLLTNEPEEAAVPAALAA
jgi:cellulose synthase (UDP-forming)